MRQRLWHLVGLYWESGLGEDVPSLAWFLLSSLAPLALGLTAMAAIALGDYAQAQALAGRVAQVLPKDVHDQVVQLILRTQRDSPLLVTGSILGMVWACSGAVGVLERCLARLVGLQRAGPVLGKLRSLGVAAALAVVIVLAVLVASAGTGIVARLQVDSVVIRIAVTLGAMSLTVLICGALFRALGRGSISRTAAAKGGVVSGIILQATPTAAGYYMRSIAGNTPVEVFLVLAGVLITCYLVALGLLLGAGAAAWAELGRPPRAAR